MALQSSLPATYGQTFWRENRPMLIAFCSQAFTLEPGDVLLTGTPHGVGLGRDPQIYMQDGDVIVVEIEGIGRLENRCRVV